jgi:hypothetical protein
MQQMMHGQNHIKVIYLVMFPNFYYNTFSKDTLLNSCIFRYSEMEILKSKINIRHQSAAYTFDSRIVWRRLCKECDYD